MQALLLNLVNYTDSNLRLRMQVLEGLRRTMEETRRSLVRVGLGRSALARYRTTAVGAGERRLQSRRA